MRDLSTIAAALLLFAWMFSALHDVPARAALTVFAAGDGIGWAEEIHK